IVMSSVSFGIWLLDGARAQNSAKELEQEIVDLLGRIELQPVARALDAFVAPVSGDVLARAEHWIFRQVVVAAAPQPERRRGHRGDGRPRLELALRTDVRAVPVQPGGERAGAREVLEVAFEIAVAARE